MGQKRRWDRKGDGTRDTGRNIHREREREIER